MFSRPKQLGHRLGFALLCFYWRLVRPVTIGVKVFCISGSRQLLLVKHSYVAGWHLPGGRVDRGESTKDCAARELFEECAIKISPSDLSLVGIFRNATEYKNDHVVLFKLEGDFPIEGWRANSEIIECRYFDILNLPADLSLGTRHRVKEFLNPGECSDDW